MYPGDIIGMIVLYIGINRLINTIYRAVQVECPGQHENPGTTCLPGFNSHDQSRSRNAPKYRPHATLTGFILAH